MGRHGFLDDSKCQARLVGRSGYLVRYSVVSKRIHMVRLHETPHSHTRIVPGKTLTDRLSVVFSPE